MKKLVILFAALLMFAATNMQAQDRATVTGTVSMTVNLTDVLELNLTGGNAIVFTFDTPTEWNSGMTAPDGGTTTTITINSTKDWYLTIESPDLTPAGGGNNMTPNTIGVWCEATGTYQFPSEVTCAYTAVGSPLELENAAATLIDNGSGNAGDATDNAYTINWECGTMNGPMNATSMLQHVAAGDFNADTFTSTVTLTLTTY